MQMTIRVVPQAKRIMLKRVDGVYKLYLTAPAVEGKANKALIAYLAKYYRVKKSSIQIIKGLKSRDKTINIDGI